MIYGNWKKDPKKAISSDPAGTHIIGAHPTPLKEGYGEDAWGRRIRDAYIFDLVYRNPKGAVGGWTPQQYTQGFRYNALGSEGLSQQMGKAKTTEQASKMAKGMGLPEPNEGLAGAPDVPTRIIPSTMSPILMAGFNAGTYGDFWNNEYRKSNPDDFWLAKDVGELAPDNMTINPKGTRERQANRYKSGSYNDQYNTGITLKNGKKYVTSASPTMYGADFKRDNPELYDKLHTTTGRSDDSSSLQGLAGVTQKIAETYANTWKDLQRNRGYIFPEDDPQGWGAPESQESLIFAQNLRNEDERKRQLAYQQDPRRVSPIGAIQGGSSIGMDQTLATPRGGNVWGGGEEKPKSKAETVLAPGYGGNDVETWKGWIPDEKDYEPSPWENLSRGWE
jgi:hypothetical protein